MNLELLALLAAVAPPVSVAPTTAAPPIVEPTASLAGRTDDAQVDQAWLSPTALTQPAGTITIESHEIALLTTTITPSDRVALTVRGLVVPDGKWLGGISGKLRVVDGDRAHVALLATGVVDRRLGANASDESFLLAGAVASLCGSASCRSLLSAYALVGPVRESTSHMFFRVLYGASLVAALVPKLKFVAEVVVDGEMHGNYPGRSTPLRIVDGMIGLRIHSGAIAATVGFLALYARAEDWITSDSVSSFTLLPALSLTGRFGGS